MIETINNYLFYGSCIIFEVNILNFVYELMVSLTKNIEYLNQRIN